MTAKPSICKLGGNGGMGAFRKSGAYARKDSCHATGDFHGVAGQPQLGGGQPPLKRGEGATAERRPAGTRPRPAGRGSVRRRARHHALVVQAAVGSGIQTEQLAEHLFGVLA